MALLVNQTLRHGLREGLKTALAPLLTDAPIVPAILFLFSRLPQSGSLLGSISIAGGAYVVWLGIESLRTNMDGASGALPAPRSIAKAMAVNLLNPHVYLFWTIVGAPTVFRALEISAGAAAGFIAGFYATLCGAKVVMALLLSRSRGLLQGRGYALALRGVGLVFCGFGLWLICDGWRLLAA